MIFNFMLFLFTETDTSMLETLKTELSEQGFDSWETSIGGQGVIYHTTLNSDFVIPSGFSDST